jgi:hypothetical protein
MSTIKEDYVKIAFCRQKLKEKALNVVDALQELEPSCELVSDTETSRYVVVENVHLKSRAGSSRH